MQKGHFASDAGCKATGLAKRQPSHAIPSASLAFCLSRNSVSSLLCSAPSVSPSTFASTGFSCIWDNFIPTLAASCSTSLRRRRATNYLQHGFGGLLSQLGILMTTLLLFGIVAVHADDGETGWSGASSSGFVIAPSSSLSPFTGPTAAPDSYRPQDTIEPSTSYLRPFATGRYSHYASMTTNNDQHQVSHRSDGPMQYSRVVRKWCGNELVSVLREVCKMRGFYSPDNYLRQKRGKPMIYAKLTKNIAIPFKFMKRVNCTKNL
ncbi:unnamed protein product [Protopolystoma xenopodis]|uniref:Uncharacterized protein n=1 Tax=Protopolystoma xenopodis TaxID=117903 RepID=A0A448WNJ1_9PLAT|nr:unnamed protein product [Protopolystoma xenopodis]